MSQIIGVIDCGTHQLKLIFYDVPNFNLICSHEKRIKQISTKDGWVEHDPIEILSAVRESAEILLSVLPNHGYSKKNIACFGVTNQRETIVLWNKGIV
jgi:glycerol kinase